MGRATEREGKEGEPVLERTGGRSRELIDTDFGRLQDDLSGGNACRWNCAKMSQVWGGLRRGLSHRMMTIGNICREGVAIQRHDPARDGLPGALPPGISREA